MTPGCLKSKAKSKASVGPGPAGSTCLHAGWARAQSRLPGVSLPSMARAWAHGYPDPVRCNPSCYVARVLCVCGLHRQSEAGLHRQSEAGLHWQSEAGLHRQSEAGLHWQSEAGLHRRARQAQTGRARQAYTGRAKRACTGIGVPVCPHGMQRMPCGSGLAVTRIHKVRSRRGAALRCSHRPACGMRRARRTTRKPWHAWLRVECGAAARGVLHA
jgi:hypothetical protein